MILLRGHHLICLHFYNGEGYGREFIDNLCRIKRKAKAGEWIEVACGPDDICTLCPYLKAGKCLYNGAADTEIMEMDQAAVGLLEVITGERVHWRNLKKNIPDIFGIWSKKYCKGCNWLKACEKETQFKELTHRLHKMKGRHAKSRKLSGLNATKIDPYSPDGTFNLMCILDKCISNSDNSALWSRLKAFLFPKAFGTFQI